MCISTLRLYYDSKMFALRAVRSNTVKLLYIRAEMFEQTVQTQIRLLLEQTDQGLHCLLSQLHL